MTELKRRKEAAEAAELRRQAFAAEKEFRDGVTEIRTAWVNLSEVAWRIKQERLWRAAGASSLDDYVEERLHVERTRFYRLAQLHEEFVVRRKVQTPALSGVEVSMAIEVLPAIRAGRVDLDKALEDARELTFRELREKYAQPKSVAAPRQENGKPEQEPEEPRRASPPERVDEAGLDTDAPSAPAEPSEPEQIRCPTCGQLADPEQVAA